MMFLSSRQLVHILKGFFNYYNELSSWDAKMYIKLMYVKIFEKGLPDHLRKHNISYKKLFDEFLKEGFTYNGIIDTFYSHLLEGWLSDYMIDLYTKEIF